MRRGTRQIPLGTCGWGLLRPPWLSRARCQHLIEVILGSGATATPLKQGSSLQGQRHVMKIAFDFRLGL